MLPLNYVPQRFPGWRYHATQPAVLVHTQEESDALGPEWTTRPSGAAPAPATPPPPPPDTRSVAEREAAELYATPVVKLSRVIATIPHLEVLDKIRRYEQDNPNGPRKGVLAAVDKREAEIKG